MSDIFWVKWTACDINMAYYHLFWWHKTVYWSITVKIAIQSIEIQKFIGLLNQLILTSIKHSRFLLSIRTAYMNTTVVVLYTTHDIIQFSV